MPRRCAYCIWQAIRVPALEDFIQALENSHDECTRQYSMQHPLPAERVKRIKAIEAQYAQAGDNGSMSIAAIERIRQERFEAMRLLF